MKKIPILIIFTIALLSTDFSIHPAVAAGCNLKVASGVDAGESTGYAWSKSGKAYAWGRGDWGQRGDGNSAANTNMPGAVKNLRATVKISASGGHALFLQKDGKVFSSGYNDAGQLGNNSQNHSLTPKLVSGLPCVVDVATGQKSSFALSRDGKVYAWGYNADGELGLGNSWPSLKPSLVKGLEGIKKIFAGDHNFFAVDAIGNVFGAGWNHSNQLGEEFKSGNVASTAIPMPHVGKVSGISFYNDHASATTIDGKAIVWGSTYRILEGGDPLNGISLPVKVDINSKVSHIESGVDQTFLISDAGDLYAWGGHNFGALGNGKEAFCSFGVPLGTDTCQGFRRDGLSYNVFMERSLVLQNVKSVSAGDNFSIALRQDGSVWSWGSGKDGQLGNGYSYLSTKPVQVYKLNLNR